MKPADALVVERAQRVLDERIRPAITARSVALELRIAPVPGEPIAPTEALALQYTPYRPGDPWGAAWSTAWFRASARIPDAWLGERIEAVVDLGFDTTWPGFQCEGLAYTPAMEPIKAINPRNQWVPIEAAPGEDVEFYIEAAANPNLLDHLPLFPTWQGDRSTASDQPLYAVKRADLTAFDVECHELALDVEVLLELQAELEDGPRRASVLRGIDRAMDAIDLHRVAETAAYARAVLRPLLERPASASEHTLSAIGHAHIDSAWLWPVRETVRKVARTTTSMTQLLSEEPEFLYGMSSAQQYEWLRDNRPEVYSRVAAAVRDGRFVPLGGMWVESDAVLPSGESLVRQFTYGQGFFRREFGITCKGVWLPDSFGYSAALPQLMRRAGFEWFLSQKLSWNQVNTFPHHTFHWEGIDGTRMFSHFPPIDTYNARLSVGELAGARRRFAQADRASGSIAAVGWGDGGGGTTREMVGRSRRLASLEGSPRVTWERPDDFFDRAKQEVTDPPVWVGELVLEAHRGTLTSQHRTKQGNRRGEQLLVEAELWAATATARAGAAYPYDELDSLWKTLLLHQFHDILPGTSIAWVHREAVESYAALARNAVDLIRRSLDALAGAGATELIANASPFERSGVPAFGIAVPGHADVEPPTIEQTDDGIVIDNGVLRVTVSADGLITSAVEKTSGRDAIASGRAAGLLQMHQDFPNTRDAWDVDAHYRNRVEDLTAADSINVQEDADGVHVVVERSFSDSCVRQRITVPPASAVIRIAQETDWHEHERLLKVAFPLALNADHTTAETQFGYVKRVTHANTSWQTAQFEHSMHRFVHAEEPGFGASLVGDSTYGYDVLRDSDDTTGVTTTVRLSLLRSPRYPDPMADQGVHTHEYALVVGSQVADATRSAIELDTPLRRFRGAKAVAPLVRVEGDGILVSALKLAADRSGDLIVRLYEPNGRRAVARLTVDADYGPGQAVSLLEEPTDIAVGAPPAPDGTLRLTPFEVLTLRFAAVGRAPQNIAGQGDRHTKGTAE
ncbi:alpha-mannosidase [Planctomonas sp. JC2975]|uniref:alpha-mannosidase n=1 Tax=Planctomonas sp. JC2975 TaxID=2729626 RepID=UPI001475A6C9|nr:glycoside hydrolase family 38 C-terminal domain-containing protein [Planctomonas sp. JC2975]NNC11569.1 alpha-mannosidase [Planctomonas sp. JC2975]